ncbi:MAG: hypothetical protein ACI9CU_001105 [Polaribacter sp.]|jgi:hypothetical protein
MEVADDFNPSSVISQTNDKTSTLVCFGKLFHCVVVGKLND